MKIGIMSGFLFAVIIGFTVASLAATSTSGSVRARVTSEDGTPLAHLVVSISGSALPIARLALESERGDYLFPLVPVGDDYTVRAQPDGFEAAEVTGVIVRLGNETRVDVRIPLMTNREITVGALRGPIDYRNMASVTNISAEQYGALPTTRDFQYLTVLAPGVLFEQYASVRPPTGAMADHPSPTIGGATQAENDYVIEGMSTRDPMTGESAAKVTMDFVKEVQVMTGEYSAEFGRALGGVINVVTKSGSNTFLGSVLTYQQNADWTSYTVRSSIKGVDSYDLGHDRNDWGASVGGPLRRNRAWFYLSYDLRRDSTPLHIFNPAHGLDRDESIDVRENVYATKLTLESTPSQRFSISAFGNPTTRSGWIWGGNITEPSAALATERTGSTNASLRYDAVLRSKFTIEATAGRHRQDLSTEPSTEQGRTAASQGDATSIPYFYYGGYPYNGWEKASRDFVSLHSSSFVGNHELRGGMEIERNRYDQKLKFDGFWWYGPSEISEEIGTRDLLAESFVDFSGYGTNDGTAAFLEDRWQISRSFFVSAGLRWERQDLSSGRGVSIADGRARDGSIIRRPAKSFVLDDNWAPRLSFSWDPAGNGRSRIYAAGGRYFESIPVNLNVWSINGARYIDRYYYSTIPRTSDGWHNPAGSPLDGNWVLFDSMESDITNGMVPGPTPIDPSTRLQYQDEFSFGADLVFRPQWSSGARLVHRTLGNVIEDHVVYDSSGEPVDYVISNIGTGLYASEFQTPERTYDAIELTLQRHLGNHWQLISSFVSSRARGDIDGFYSYANRNFGSAPNTTFDIETPEFQHNSYGRLRGDRPYEFKLHASYEFPFGVTLSEGFVYSAGFPISAFAWRNLTGGIRQLYLLPRGSAGRTPDYYSLDLHAAWRVPIHAGRRMSAFLIADVFNATDSHQPLAVDQDYFYRGMPGYAQWVAPSNLDENGYPRFNPNLPKSPYFGTPTLYQTPRTYQAGAKFEF